jgi:hypothetical protein
VSTSSFTLPGTIASATALARAFGPMLCASDDPADPAALLAAQANYRTLAPGWCRGHADPREDCREAYFRDQASGFHGWMCCQCRKITQTG